MSLLPVFLKLAGRRCLVVGAGEVASGKIESLVGCGARVTVVAPWASPQVSALAARGALTWHARAFEDADLDGQFVVVTGTDQPSVNQRVYRLCDAAGILCNAVDDPPHCDFYYGSVVTRGDLQIAISTTGQSPAVAQRLRREIDAQLPADLGPWLQDLGALRREVLAAQPAGEERKLLLHRLGEHAVCASAECPARAMARRTACDRRSPAAVALVGAGPGDPELLTLKAARLLAAAELVLHDDLVPPAILALASPSAEVMNVGKRCGRAAITQAGINERMIQGYREGKMVVRLKSGDPLIFGRAGEEMEALRAAGVPYEVVAGVTAASAAAAALPCSLTDRRDASSLLLTTAHHAHDTAPGGKPTRVAYMPGRNLTSLAEQWRREGMSEETPCVVVSCAGQPAQQVVYTRLNALGSTRPVSAPSIVMAGNVFRAHCEAIKAHATERIATPTPGITSRPPSTAVAGSEASSSVTFPPTWVV